MNSKNFLGIKEIWQKDNFSFAIKWSNDKLSVYQLEELQKCCPCAGCKQKKRDNQFIPKQSLRAHRIYSVGHYALRIEFTEGCSAGIYDFDLLHSLGEPQI